MSREEANRIARATERLRRTRRLGLKVGVPTVAALGAGAAFAVGAIPGNDGTITGCYVTTPSATNPGAERYGELRVIDPSVTTPGGRATPENSCEQDEATITWSQRGPEGPQGLQGPQGVGGAQGAAGRALIGQTTFGLGGGGGTTFLKLDGIRGESTEKDHKGEIEIESFQLSATNASSGGGAGSGRGAGKTISSFTITKKLDKSSPALFQAAGSGKTIKLADVTFAHRKAGRGQQEYLQFKFDQVLVSSIQQGNGGGGKPTEQVTFNFAKAQETFLSSNGKPLQSVQINVGANKKA
ncbi:MAG TPA: type VI secretion system tube protein Hcp [Conexibacter sp.]|nr:type VI secretion system tube protein Hcp [Conexibacter sp.]